MTVFRPKDRKHYRFDFYFQGARHHGSTFQTRKEDARRVEQAERDKLRKQAAGLYTPSREDSPEIQEWAGIFLEHKERQLERPDALAAIIPVALRFWGRPTWPDGRAVEPSPEHPCLDCRLCDPILNPDLILQWEAWLTARGLSNQSKNHYRGLMRRMYQVAMLPEYRQRTGVQLNPFAGVPNDPTFERTVTLEPDELAAWIAHASYHVRLAVAINALAPKLRLRNVLGLRWSTSFDPDPRGTKFDPAKADYYLVIRHHKTERRTRRPLVSPINEQLLAILKDAHARNPEADTVVTYHGRAVTSIRDGVQAAVEAAGLRYGRDVEGGVTFHTIRHTAATLLSDEEPDPLKLRDAMGHGDLRTTLKYRHKRPDHERPLLERLSTRLPIASLVTAPRRRAIRKKKSA